jgi:hypothetical protein
VFEVNGQDKFHAHRLILQACAPTLAEYCDGAEEMTPVPIAGVKPDIFRHVLYYVYGGAVPKNVLSKSCKAIIEAADRFGLGNLKVEAEGWYVESTSINSNNFVENLYFSDTMKCALLKEKVMDFLVQNEMEALSKLSQKDVPQSESMLTDFLTASARKKHKGNAHEHEFKTMSINAMRRELDQRGFGVDGTREMLISALELCHHSDGAVVEGAGLLEINGHYMKARDKWDDAPKYIKHAQYNGEDVQFTLFRCQLTDSSRRWYLSIVPASALHPGTNRDIDFYCTLPSFDIHERTPPRDDWMLVPNSRATMPPPEVHINAVDQPQTQSLIIID